MNDARLAELAEMYADRDLIEELAWGVYANHSGSVRKEQGEFINWLCFSAYKALKALNIDKVTDARSAAEYEIPERIDIPELEFKEVKQ